MKQSTFPFQVRESSLLGSIRRPLITVSLWSEVLQKWHKVEMLVDTGADYTILPSYLAILLEVDLEKAKKVDAQGVGGAQTVYFFPALPIKIGEMERVVPVGFIRKKNIPPLLGRAGCFETFISTFVYGETLTLKD